MPGFVDYKLAGRCPDCDGPVDPWIKGRHFHKPTCPTQPGHEEAQVREDEARARRQKERAALVASPEAKRLRALRTVA